MANVTVGGDPESYMDAPRISSGGKGGMNPIAAFLDLIGLHKQVAQEPAGGTVKDAAPTNPQPAQPAPQMLANPTGTTQKLTILDDAESAFKPIEPLPSDWGQKYLKSILPIQKIDPNKAFGGM